MTPTCVAARPMPSASCISSPIRRDLVAQRVVEALDRQRAALAAPGRRTCARARSAASRRARVSGSSARASSGSLGLDGSSASSDSSAIVVEPSRRVERRYCGSTSTLKATSAVRAVAARPLDRARRPRAIAAARSVGLDHDLDALAAAQAEQRRRARARRPPGAATRRAPRRRPRRRGGPASADEQTTRIRSANGG